MAWSSLLGNQMVTESDAAESGLTLNPGQSHGSGNRCMTRSEAATRYQMNGNAMTGYGSNQLVPRNTWLGYSKSFHMGLTEGSPGTCAIATGGIPYGLFTKNPNLSVGDVLYADQPLLVPWNATNFTLYYGLTNSLVTVNGPSIVSISTCVLSYNLYVNIPTIFDRSIIFSDAGKTVTYGQISANSSSQTVSLSLPSGTAGIYVYLKYAGQGTGLTRVSVRTVSNSVYGTASQSNFTDGNLVLIGGFSSITSSYISMILQ
jgi:hypothetical protein